MTRRRSPSTFDPTAPFPPILTIDELSVIYRISTATIRRRLRKGIFRPLPWDKSPFRWSKVDVERDLVSRRTDERLRDHGYEPSKRGRPVKSEAYAHDYRTKSTA